jgi:hypothetical protein
MRTTRSDRPTTLHLQHGAEDGEPVAPRVSDRLSRVTKLKPCAWCGTLFTRWRSTEKVCSATCAISFTREEKRKELVSKARRERREYRERTAGVSKLKNLAQREFNKFIRLRDDGKPCISCGRNTGAKMNAGHYRTTKAAPHLRYDERACFLQCEHCNTYLSGNQIEYRKALVARFGAGYVEELEGDSGDKKWSRDELIAIRKDFLGRWKALKAAREAT